MTKEQMLKNFIEKNVESFEKAKTGLEALRMLGSAIENHVMAFEEISEIFQKRGLGNMWIECPECFSPVLLNYKDCNVCGRALLDGGEEEPAQVEGTKEEEVEEAPEKKVTKKKATKKKAAKKKVAKKTTKKKTTKKKAVKKVVKEEPVEEEETEGSDYPSEDKVNAMDKQALIKLIKKEKLDIDLGDYKGRGALDNLREAVNDAIDFKIDEENANENEEEEIEEIESPEIEEEETEEEESEEEEELEEESEEEAEKDDDFDFDFGDEEEEEEE